MFYFIQKSLANRLLFAFISIGAIPFVIFLVYTLILSETKIVNKLIGDQHHELQIVKKSIDIHLKSLAKEVSFLARLDVMDDILSDDIDKRISRMLEKKRDDYTIELDFSVVSENSIIIASSNKEKISKVFNLFETIEHKHGFVLIGENLYIYSNIFASFDDTKELGLLVLKYRLDNLKEYFIEKSSSYIYMKNKKHTIGNEANIQINIKSTKDSLGTKDYIIVYQKMDNILKDWYIFYALKKDVSLEFFYDFIKLMLYLFPFIVILTIFISYKFSKYIVKPIEELTELTDEIIDSKDYSKFLNMNASDEVGRLAKSFNTLLNTTDKTLDASEAKSAFISNLSHELKTPLNAIIGFSQYLISYEKLTDEQLDIVSNIESSSQYLLEMIYGILDIAKIEAGKMELHVEQLNVKDLAEECFSMLEPLADDKGLDFELKCENTKNLIINNDKKILKQIIINLLSNSIKFTQDGFVKLEIYNKDENIVIEVQDSGIGLAKEHIKKLFKDFSQIENGLIHKQKGTGLGLSLSKKLSHVVGGDIILHSDGIGLGSKAIFTLKLEDLS